MSEVPLLIVACGGTGGHFFPGISLAKEWHRRGLRTRLIIGGKNIPSQISHAEKEGLEADPAFAVALPRKKYLYPFWTIAFVISVIRAVFYILMHKPQAILTMGSFANIPLGVAAAICRTPLYLHEGNTVCGRANRVLSRWARLLFTSFPLTSRFSISCQTVEDGLPLREDFYLSSREERQRQDILNELKLPLDKKIILAFGGSLGAGIINRNLPEACRRLPKDFHLIHLCGNGDPEELQKAYDNVGVSSQVIKSVTNMADYYRAADITIARAGASSLAEMALMQCCLISIPFKKAADQHQLRNAEYFAREEALILIKEDDLNVEKMAKTLEKLLNDEQLRNTLKENIGRLAKPKAPASLIESILKNLNL